ncbi:Uncharacterized protein SCF082_LOCUS34789, partial [Durusdinium trenchii]
RSKLSERLFRCQEQGIINADGATYLLAWSRGEWESKSRPRSYSFLHHRPQSPLDGVPAFPRSWEKPRRVRTFDVSARGDESETASEEEEERVPIQKARRSNVPASPSPEVFHSTDDEKASETEEKNAAETNVNDPELDTFYSSDVEDIDGSNPENTEGLSGWTADMELGARGFISRAVNNPDFSELRSKLKSLSAILSRSHKSTIRVGTICSGIGTQEMIGEIFEEQWNRANPVEHSFLCENDTAKIDFLLRCFPDAHYLFTDMKDVAQGLARDCKTDGWVEVPKAWGVKCERRVDGLVSGFPCISVSPLNMDPKGFKDTSSATGCGFKSVTDYVQRSRPQWIAMENVKTLVHARAVDGYKKPIYYILETMKKLGYFSAFDAAMSSKDRELKWPEKFEEANEKERVDKMLLRIRSEKLLLPERELAILAVACVDLQVNFGMDPCKEELVDQNFDRGTFLRSNPKLANCTIPKGKYVITKRWRLLTSQDLWIFKR